MNRIALSLLCAAGLFLATTLVARGQDFPLAPAVESKPRMGLPHFLSKAKTKGAELKVAYFGGSITAQQGWRVKSLAFLKEAFPEAKFSEINAAIGGTGSDLGVFRLRQDVLDKKPDLMFVEFAVNDGGAPPDQIVRCMEGIVRQTWRALPECDICFVYTLVDGFAPTLQAGKFPRAASVMEKIADHYGIPSIHMGMEVARLAEEGKLIFKGKLPKTPEEKAAAGDVIAFSEDGVHPYPETGHELYMKAIVRSWPGIAKASTKTDLHELPKPFATDNYERAKMIPITKAMLSEGIAPAAERGKQFANRVSNLHKADKAGQTITFKFKGTRAGIYDVIGPDTGVVLVTIDNEPAVKRQRFDVHCTYHRLATLRLATELPNVEHTVKIEVSDEKLDKAKILAERQKTMDKPEQFEESAFYPAAILLVGELVE